MSDQIVDTNEKNCSLTNYLFYTTLPQMTFSTSFICVFSLRTSF